MYRRCFKRLTGAFLSALALALLSPLLALLSLAVALDSKGPVIFAQQRLGLYGRVFTMYKFRSMCPGAEAGGVYSDRHDARVTRMGRVLRATSLDELPQLWNVLRGDMAIVGPRPALTYHPWPLEAYTPHQRHMFDVRPGLTGWAQVHGRKDVPWPERIELNVWYAEHLSPGLDLRILWRTVGKVLTNADNENTVETAAGNERRY